MEEPTEVTSIIGSGRAEGKSQKDILRTVKKNTIFCTCDIEVSGCSI